MFIADTHSDTLYAIGVSNTPQQELMITPEKLRKGGVSLQTFALWTGRDGNRGDYEDIVRKELAARKVFEDAGIHQVDDPACAKDGENAYMLSVEGGEVFEKGLEAVDEFRNLGVRMTALVWNNENAIGYPAKSGEKKGLKAYGLNVVRKMQSCHMAIDTSHLNEAGFWDIFHHTNVPPLASHSCCMSLCHHFRNLTDEQIRAMIRDGGYIGINFYPAFLSENGTCDVDRVAEHIDYVCQMGGEHIVGFGSDFDGIETAPKNLTGADEVPNLLEALRRRGMPEDAITGIAGGNLLAYFSRI
ncbi:MAG: membrane dipeptidase [Clostridiales bacterium]|nr:membrane dipeptidase [Clostridiales bacterium]